MKRPLLVGSALGLLLAAAPALAGTSAAPAPGGQQTRPGAMLLAQDETPQPGAAEEVLPKKHRKKPAEAAQQPQGEAAAPAPEPQAEPSQQAEQLKPRKQHKPVVEEAAPALEPQAEPSRQAEQLKPRKQHKPAVEEAAPAPEPQAEPSQQAEQLKPRKQHKPVVEEAAPAPEPQAVPSQQAEQLKPRKQHKPVVEEAAPAPKPQAEPAQQAEQRKPKKGEPASAEPEVQTGEQAAPTPKSKPQVQPNPPAQQEAPATTTAEQPATRKPDNEAAGAPEPQAPAATTVTPTTRPAPPATGTAEAQPENAAPVLDSAKEEQAAPDQTKTGSAVTKPRKPTAPPAPPPTDDSAAQAELRPEKVETVTAERGRRIAEAPPPVPLADNRPQGVDVLKEIGDRVLVEINNQVVVQSSDRPRMERGARDVYYEDLGGGRTRETVVREDGAQVVTIRNQYGDIVRRSRVTEDGREYIIAYVDDRDYQRLDDWHDVGDDLPPLQLDVPMDEYVLDADNVDDPDTYYQFLERPPVERVERLYSVDEVKRSARIRDKLPRIELDTVTFDFGSTSIGEDQIPKLQAVAEAIDRLLKKNPAESFLIEGHTDAVGSDVANLALSDKRAEAVAQALTNVFGIPPENLATQGYGERYLKVETDQPEQRNRRVVMRRITPLVAPVASAQ
jgi:outer membrane protein OmpA-like peptidoglycan-associated protein